MPPEPSNFLQDLVNKLISPPNFFSPPIKEISWPREPSEPSQNRQRRTGDNREKSYQQRLARELGGQTEVATPDGRIDVLTTREIIEVKAAAQWKQALGQILVYGQYYPYHQKRIHLFGEISQSALARVRQQCQSYGVTITWEP